jgi:hypothetical protein
MPTVFTFEGLRVMVYPNDHRPAHVHVMGRGCEAVFNLSCPAGPPRLRENFRFSLREIKQTAAVLIRHLVELCRAWERIHDMA